MPKPVGLAEDSPLRSRRSILRRKSMSDLTDLKLSTLRTDIFIELDVPLSGHDTKIYENGTYKHHLLSTYCITVRYTCILWVENFESLTYLGFI